MKKVYFHLTGVFTLLVFFASCSKSEQAAVKDEIAQVNKHQLSVPLKDGRTAIALNVSAVSDSSKIPDNPFSNVVRSITAPTEEYLRETTLMDYSGLTDYSVYDSIADKQLKVNFVSGLKKMPNYPNGWTAKWNSKSLAGVENPSVLYTMQENHLSIILSKYVVAFGFELAPNLYNSYEFTAGYYTSLENSPVARITRLATTPLGAQLFAVHSERPFNVIEISFTGGDGTENHPYGFAIANIRYRLCEE